MGLTDEFPEIARANEPLAPLTFLRIGGPAECLVEPRDRAELAAVLRRCGRDGIPLRVLGTGCNLLVRDEGVPGAVLRLTAPEFTAVRVEGRSVRAGSGAALSSLITHAARQRLSGVETLVGIFGTVGGAVRCNSGDRTGEIGQFVRRLEVLDEAGEVRWRDRSEVRFSEHQGELDDPVILSVEFELEPDETDAIVRRMRKAWIQRKAEQPLSFQHSVRAFKNPKGYRAAELIEQAGQGSAKVGGAWVSDRNANYVVTQPGTLARDVLRLLEVVRTRVREQTGVDLEQEVIVW